MKNEVARLRASPTTEVKEESAQSQPVELPGGRGALTPEAAARLQDRFTQTMRQLAETFDEKQKLEHLVMQLQGETETIGEQPQTK